MTATENISTEDFSRSYQTTLRIAVILFVSSIVLIGSPWFLTSYIDNSVEENAISALWYSIIFLLVAALVFRRIFFTWKKFKQTAEQRGIGQLLVSLQNKTIVLCLIGEVIAILGFLLAILSGNRLEAFRAGVIALIVFIFNFPRKKVWQTIIANVQKN